ncbi:MAG: Rpn family recombination-promoting nuclease/putative transposase [Microlunatus sp.]
MTDSSPPDPSSSGPPAGQPHDGLFKAILGKPEHAASELRSVLPAALTNRLDLDRLERVDGSFVDQALRQQHTDVLFRTRLDEREALIYVLLEHQSKPDHWMALRMCGYLVRIWNRHIDDHPGQRHLPPIIPIVVYQGRAAWTSPKNLIDLIDVDQELVALTPDCTYLLDDVRRLNVQQLRARPLTDAVRLTFVLMREAPGNEHLAQDLEGWRTDLQGIVEGKHLPDLIALWTYALSVSNTPEQELTDYLARLGPEAKEVAMTTADLLRAEGEARGRAEGEARGRAETLLELLSIKFAQVPDETERRVRTASSNQLEVWTRRLLAASTLDEIFA